MSVQRPPHNSMRSFLATSTTPHHFVLKRGVRTLAIAMLGLASTGLWAQVVPNAGDVSRETAKPPVMPPKTEPTLPKPAEIRPQLQTVSGFSMVVGGFRITGNKSIQETDLQLLLTEVLGKKASFAELQAAADGISRYYRDRGYFVARAYLPQQEIKDGIVEIAVLEGQVGKTIATVGGTARTSASVVQGILDANVPAGSVVQERSIERAALLVNDLPGLSAGASLDPGAATGETDVTIAATEGRLVTGGVDIDNYGNRYTGQTRLGGTLNLNSPLGIGDQASLRLMKSDQKLGLIRASYSLPVGSQGARIGASASRVGFEVCCQVGLNPSGSSTNYSVFGLYPIVRQRDTSVFFNAVVDNKTSVNDSGVGAPRVREINALTMGVSAELRDQLGGGGFNFANLSVGAGSLNIKDATDAGADAAGPKASGAFTKVGLQLARTQRLTDRFSLYGGVNAQMANKNLDSAEKFGLGGAQAVRGYPSGEAVGDAGYIAQLELRADLPINALESLWQGFLFTDYGSITQNRNNFVAAGLIPNSYVLKSWGLGLNVAKAGTFQVRTMWASKIGDNPGRNILTGNDADGKSSRSRFWLQATTQF